MKQVVSFRSHSACAAACFAAAASCAHCAHILLSLPDTMRLVSGFLLRILKPIHPRQRSCPIC